MEGAALSVLLGLLGGVVGWTLAQLLLRPRLRWSSGISRLESPDFVNGVYYRVKLKNASWLRSIDDLSFQARVYFTHTRENGSRVGRSLRLGSAPVSVHRLRPRANQLLTVEVSEMNPKSLRLLASVDNYAEARAPDRSMETLLELPGAFFSVQVRAHDAWTGSAHSLESPRLRTTDEGTPIFDGHFRARRRRSGLMHAQVTGWVTQPERLAWS